MFRWKRLNAARAHVREVGADACVAIGGGSTIGLAKAIALDFPLPVIAIPTTYAGSEMTPIWGLTDKGIKKTGRDISVLPRTVIYDPLLTLALPPIGVRNQRHQLDRPLRRGAVFGNRQTP